MHSLNTLHESSPKKTCQQYQQLVVFLFLIYVATIHISISVEGTVSLLSGLIHHKATLPDIISAYFLKELSNQLSPILTSIFQSSLYQLRASTRSVEGC